MFGWVYKPWVDPSFDVTPTVWEPEDIVLVSSPKRVKGSTLTSCSLPMDYVPLLAHYLLNS
jgi:hypothetical protein